MKKAKRQRPAETERQAERTSGAVGTAAAPVRKREPKKSFVWWPWASIAGAVVLALLIYGPSFNGEFVLDDLYLPFANTQLQGLSFLGWVKDARPVLMLSFWLNHAMSGQEPYAYHVTNVLLHCVVAVLAGLIAMRLLQWTGASQELARTMEPGAAGHGDFLSSSGRRAGPVRASEQRPVDVRVGIFAGALFLVHPLQTESVAYVSSRSEVLSVLFYYAAYCVFLYRRTASITILRALAVLVLFGCALGSKQHTLTLPALMLLTDLYWPQGSVKANRLLYAIMVVIGAAGGLFILRTLLQANTAGFHIAGLTPLDYFYTQCRVVWTYVRLFVFPFGQNADPDVAISHSLLDGGAILGLLAWIAAAAAAWIYRKRWPLASFGVFVYLLLLAPTSSIIPIQDVLQERRLYLPFIGLALVVVDFLRRVEWRQRVTIEACVLIVMAALTYQRSALWGDPIQLWSDASAKSPNKFRPRFQLAHAYYVRGRLREAVDTYAIASKLGPPDYRLLVDYGLALDHSKQYSEALDKLRQATTLEADPEVWTLIGQVYGEQHKVDQAFEALDQAQRINPNFEMTYAIRGDVYESVGNLAGAAEEFQRTLQIDPYNEPVRKELVKVQRELERPQRQP